MITLHQAHQFVKQQYLDHESLDFDGGSIDLGVCAVCKVSIKDSPKFLYWESFEGTCGIAESLSQWIDQDWSDPSSDFSCQNF